MDMTMGALAKDICVKVTTIFAISKRCQAVACSLALVTWIYCWHSICVVSPSSEDPLQIPNRFDKNGPVL